MPLEWEDDIPMTTPSTGGEGDIYYWHVHHEVLCEALTEPIQNRIDYIKSDKPASEVETRLRCMTPVLHPGELPAKWREAYAKLEEAGAKWREAGAKCLPQLEALHKKEHPDCPWDGKTIFPEKVA